MSDFMENMLAAALREINSDHDADVLAGVIMKLTEEPSDAVWASSQRTVLAAVIEEVSKSPDTQNLSSIYSILNNNLESTLTNSCNRNWLEFKDHTTENFRSSVVTRLYYSLACLEDSLHSDSLNSPTNKE